MRKLIYLASFTAQTGGNEFSDKRLVLIEEQEGDTHETISDRAFKDHFMPWFRVNYPESKLDNFVCHETISKKDAAESQTKLFQVKWRTPEVHSSQYLFWIGDNPEDGVVIAGVGATKESAALDFVEKFMVRNDLMILQYI